VIWVHAETGRLVSEVGGYTVLYGDPCWRYENNGRGAATKHYSTMSLDELSALPVADLAARDAVLFLWATWPTLPDAFALMKAWGFQYKNCGFLWAKTNKKKPTPFVGLGHWTRGNTEPCLLGVRGKPERLDAAVQQLVLGEELVVAPVGRHSEKPAEVRDRILKLMGDQPAVELFARTQVSGWDSWGNEVESTVWLVEEERPKFEVIISDPVFWAGL